jgi:hypothetical protein
VGSATERSAAAGRRTATQWERRGLLLAAPPQRSWSCSHVALPAVERTAEGVLNLYYSPRDERGRAHIARARLDVGPGGELTVAAHDPEPVLSPGELGAFDDAGVTVSCVVDGGARGGTLLYYTGWSLGLSVPFYLFAGLAVRRPGERAFERVSSAPILERNAVDPYLTASPWVLRGTEGVWHMWYVSCAGWEMLDAAPRHRYHVRYAQSADGVRWRREGTVAIDFKDEGEYALGRPCVMRDGDRYRMWLCARGESYRLAYAESADGQHWERDDTAIALDAPSEKWDSEMEAYPVVFDHGGERYLLYNGNGYGRSGVGHAVCGWEE